MGVNAGGALFTAQAAGRQMIRFGNGGSIILVASICGSIAMEVRKLLLRPRARGPRLGRTRLRFSCAWLTCRSNSPAFTM